MSGFHSFRPPLLQLNRYLLLLQSTHARPDLMHAASELAMDMVDLCNLQEQLTPGLWSAELQKVKAIMQTLIQAIDGFLFHGAPTKEVRQQQRALECLINNYS